MWLSSLMQSSMTLIRTDRVNKIECVKRQVIITRLNMMNLEHTILDYINYITVPGGVFKNPENEYWALICLREGMDFLYRQAKHCDDVVKQSVNSNSNIDFVGFGNLPLFQGIPKALLTCSFHWYAVSACNYVRTIGAIACRYDSAHPTSLVYIQKVIPAVLAFRDKVAAHFAWSTNNTKDNDADRLISIIPQLTYINDSFHVGALTGIVRKGGKASKSKDIKPWSICKVHEELQKRYWPKNGEN